LSWSFGSFMKKGGGGRQNWHPRGMPFAHSCICVQGCQQKHSEGRKNTEDTALKKKFQGSFAYSCIRAEPNKNTDYHHNRSIPYGG
jgi:hypothetical protein